MLKYDWFSFFTAISILKNKIKALSLNTVDICHNSGLKLQNRRWYNLSEYAFIEGPMADGGVDTIVGIYVAHPNIFTKFLV